MRKSKRILRDARWQRSARRESIQPYVASRDFSIVAQEAARLIEEADLAEIIDTDQFDSFENNLTSFVVDHVLKSQILPAMYIDTLMKALRRADYSGRLNYEDIVASPNGSAILEGAAALAKAGVCFALQQGIGELIQALSVIDQFHYPALIDTSLDQRSQLLRERFKCERARGERAHSVRPGQFEKGDGASPMQRKRQAEEKRRRSAQSQAEIDGQD